MTSAGGLRVCLTFDVDAVSLWTATFRSASPSEISRGEFSTQVAVPRLLDLLDRNDVPATFFVPAVTARQFRESIASIAAGGHEIGAHGDLHERLVKLEPGEETAVHERSVETLTEVTGTRPRGFRAPGWELSLHTIGILEDLGFTYDSSQMATEFTPYRTRRGDRVDGTDWAPGTETDVWEIPPAWELDDFPPFFARPPTFVPTWTVEQVEAAWREEFDVALTTAPGGVFTLTMHPEVIGRGPRLAMLDRLIAYMRTQDGVTFAPMGQVADELVATTKR
jgi:peptidoglycan/xylan/chitin deacetylase (PgdA/CDA1 family)